MQILKIFNFKINSFFYVGGGVITPRILGGGNYPQDSRGGSNPNNPPYLRL